MMIKFTNSTAVVWPGKIVLIEWLYVVFASIMENLRSFLFEDAPSFKAKTLPPAKGARDCVLIIDVSGSMFDDDWKPTRLDAAIDAANTFIRRLRQEAPEARIAIVIFGCKAKVICRLTTARTFGKISPKIDQIDVGASTNMDAGLKSASALLKNSARNCQVVLLTDGQNTGENPEKLADNLKRFATIECSGIGGSPADVDEPLLRRIASAYPNGQKRYRWIGQKDQLIKHFHNLAGAIRRA